MTRFLAVGCVGLLDREREVSAAASQGVTWSFLGHSEALDKPNGYLSRFDLVYLEWDSQRIDLCRSVLNLVDGAVPLIVVYVGSYNSAPADLVAYERRHSKKVIRVRDLSSAEDTLTRWNALDVKLPVVSQGIPVAQIGSHAAIEFCSRLRNSFMGDEQGTLRWMLSKFFPHAHAFTLHEVGGGWSGAQLIRVSQEGLSGGEYFIKLFESIEALENESRTHKRAQEWLDKRTVEFIGPRLRGRDTPLALAWPNCAGVFPACYRSGSSSGRRTLKAMFGDTGVSENSLDTAIDAVLAILDQPDPVVADRSCYSDQMKEKLQARRDRRLEIKAQFTDLGRHGRHLIPDWDARVEELDRLLFSEVKPRWLTEPVRTKLGHVHGDLNSRNILVSGSDPRDVLIIDNGTYAPEGYLVFDIAQLETDIKLLLMGTETPLGDLDPDSFHHWMSLERSTCAEYLIEQSLVVDKSQPPCISRAYRLILRLRSFASPLLKDDPDCVQYFGCLLHWNLRWLRQPSIRRVKKLLAIFSASEINRRLISLYPEDL